MTAYLVRAYRGRRNFHLEQGDYSQTVRDEPGQPPAKERAEALRRELAERSHRNRLGWTHITITPQIEEDDMTDQPFALEVPDGEPRLIPQILHFDSVQEAQQWAAAYDADKLAEERDEAARKARS